MRQMIDAGFDRHISFYPARIVVRLAVPKNQCVQCSERKQGGKVEGSKAFTPPW
jgi:hypothetical protein